MTQTFDHRNYAIFAEGLKRRIAGEKNILDDIVSMNILDQTFVNKLRVHYAETLEEEYNPNKRYKKYHGIRQLYRPPTFCSCALYYIGWSICPICRYEYKCRNMVNCYDCKAPTMDISQYFEHAKDFIRGRELERLEHQINKLEEKFDNQSLLTIQLIKREGIAISLIVEMDILIKLSKAKDRMANEEREMARLQTLLEEDTF